MRFNALVNDLLVEEVVGDAIRRHDHYVVMLHLVIVGVDLLFEVGKLVAHTRLIGTVEELVLLLHGSEPL